MRVEDGMRRTISPTSRNPQSQLTPLELALRKSADLNRSGAAVGLTIIWVIVFSLDGSTGPHFSLNTVYLLPLCFTVWCLGRAAGLLSGLLGVAVTLYLNGFRDGLSAQASTVPTATAIWNVGARAFGVLFIILFVSAFRRTFDRERATASIDHLTGLGNRRAFQIECARLELASARDDRILLCGVIDVDDFKAVNDQHGHAAGDEVLRVVATALASAVRPYDITARLGGDEFAFCLAVRDQASAERKSGKIHRAIMAALQSTDVPATCSLGAATGTDFAQTLLTADLTMYGAKQAGKSSWSFNIESAPSYR